MKYRYLNDIETNKLELFVDDYIEKNNLPEKISKLKFEDFTEQIFSYIDMFEILITSKIYTSNSNNIYYDCDEFCTKNNISTSPVENRNSLYKIIGKHYKKYIKYFDKRVIELIKRRIVKYKEIYNEYEEYLSTKVKNEFQYIIDSEKYNL